MDKAAAEREAIRLWRSLPLQERLTAAQASAFAAMIAPTLDFGDLRGRAKLIDGWLRRDLPRTDHAVAIALADGSSGQLHLSVPPWPEREGASAIAFVVALLVFIARRPDLLTNAMLWAEDGAVWFAQAYNEGWWAPLLRPYAGFVQLFQRLVFDVATFLPVRWVPLFGVWVSLLVRAALPAFLFSRRFSWVHWRAKVAFTAYYLLMPNLGDAHANVSNTPLYLGLYLLAVVLADPPRNRYWRAHDWLVLLLAGLSGPFAIFALPILAFRLFAQRDRAMVWQLFTIVAAGLSAVQLAVLGWTVSAPGQGMGNGWIDRFETVVTRVVFGFITTVRWATSFATPAVAIPAALFALVIIVAVLVRGDWRARGVALVTPLVVLFAMLTPSLTGHAGPALAGAAASERYFIITSATWAATLIAFAAIYLPRLPSSVFAFSVAVCGVFILFEFPISPVAGTAFGPQASRIEAAKPGEQLVVPIAPTGWTMTLTKH